MKLECYVSVDSMEFYDIPDFLDTDIDNIKKSYDLKIHYTIIGRKLVITGKLKSLYKTIVLLCRKYSIVMI